MSTIGSRIRKRREELGLSQDELGKKLGYKSRSSINKIELDQRNLTQSKIKAIADALDTTPAYIMGWNESEMKGDDILGIGARIKEAREAKGLTQKELGELVGVTGSAITNYEVETSHPKEKVLYKLIDALGVDANYLFQDCVSSLPASLSPNEQLTIKKYRTLDEYGKKNVDTILDNEYERCNPKPAPEPIRLEDSRPVVSPNLRAAHNDNTEPDQLEKMQRDLDWLSKQ